MDFGKVDYIIKLPDRRGNNRAVKLKLTLIGQDDDLTLKEKGLAELRRARVLRLANEAVSQCTVHLGYEDLCGLLMTSLSTIKRDIKILEQRGYPVPIKGRRVIRKGVVSSK